MISRLISRLHQRGLLKAGTAYLVSAWALAKFTELSMARFEAPEWVMQSVLALLVIGFPVVLATAWFVDVKSLTIPTDDANDDASGESALAIPLVSMVADDKSIAVLPFVNISRDADNEYFADGLAEELLNLLAHVKELKVSARTSSFTFKGKNEDAREIGKKLNVAHLLEGSVRKSAAMVRVTAQLIRTKDGYHTWSETYDRRLEDIFALQDEISATIVDALKIRLIGEMPTARKTDPIAFAFYVKGNQLLASRDAASVEGAMECFQQALALDQDYAAAYVGVASVYGTRMQKLMLPVSEGVGLSRAALDKAISLDPTSALALSSSAVVAAMFEGDWQTARAHADEAIKIAPGHAGVLSAVSVVYKYLGDAERAEKIARESVSLNPLSLMAHFNLGKMLMSTGNFSAARTCFRKTLEMTDETPGAREELGIIALLAGKPELALNEVDSEPLNHRRDQVIAMAHFAMGRTEQAEADVEQMQLRYGDDAAFEIARIFAFADRKDEAFAWLDRAIDKKDTGIYTALLDPILSGLRADARWQRFIRRGGLPEDSSAGS